MLLARKHAARIIPEPWRCQLAIADLQYPHQGMSHSTNAKTTPTAKPGKPESARAIRIFLAIRQNSVPAAQAATFCLHRVAGIPCARIIRIPIKIAGGRKQAKDESRDEADERANCLPCPPRPSCDLKTGQSKPISRVIMSALVPLSLDRRIKFRSPFSLPIEPKKRRNFW